MRYVNEFRNSALCRKLLEQIKKTSKREVNLMEVCGTHTVAIFRFGIRGLLPANIKLLSGPGCPVCVTSNRYIDEAIELAQRREVILATFGDIMKVPGSHSSLAEARAARADIRIIYSTLDAVKLARENPQRQVVLMGIGFETTTPTIAYAILAAAEEGLANFSVLCAIKTMPGALTALLEDKKVNIDGFILPGHVSTIIGTAPYQFVASKYHIPGVVTGFEPADILQGILWLVEQVEKGEARIENQYSRGVRASGNEAARKMVERVFRAEDSSWRGIGVITGTGLGLRDEFCDYDAQLKFAVNISEPQENPACRCGEVLRGIKRPLECSLFGQACTPENPLGACMVSIEGTCAAYYRYNFR